jgi:hypothetical protein
MADIFISYSKSDHALALKLSTFLESEGWTVWWDKSLAAADLYRDEIMKQLDAARTVITIWTPNSIKSGWVRAEAERANAKGKLIPVKTSELTYADIPLPFGEMHTEDIASTDLIRAAIVAQLAKPAVEPTAWTLLTKAFKYELLTWLGIIGGVLTLFTNISATLKLADWARLLVDNWKQWTHAFWLWVFGWLGIHLPPAWTPLLSFLVFGTFLAMGQALKFRKTINQPTLYNYDDKSFRLLSRRTWFCLVSIVISLTPMIAYALTFAFLPEKVISPEAGWLPPNLDLVLYSLRFGPPVITVLYSKQKWYATGTVSLVTIFFNIIAANPLSAINANFISSPIPVCTAFAVASVLPLILLIVAPALAVTRRLMFLAICLVLLIALNELSNLRDVLAPKLHEWGL